ncbi:hypothetical protein NCCP2716_12940 [Sporosarcina sp. NCCP-2716]|uniref:prepilin-type N-terminal cleavage/methylation domain-containing protein n=1 Tax=Sporosarcina sp. NCCP-2716 TaxID=2943679 RepID=UPI00203D5F72|nr:prepilin-type N-terminal cleavage/methylation domain-containing protein [Sporosarcina sp. NCCP-2716]GKV68796.1 hypothetical protein NCCP2716_12940 [Sporosarcina sp. NCCP-2716]
MKIGKLNQRGLTLVELLAVLVLISLVTALIWTTISISFKHTEVETTKLQLQQEANLVITKLQAAHRKGECYDISISDNNISVKACEGTEVLLRHTSDQFRYGPSLEENIEPKEEDLKLPDFTIESIKDHKKLKVPTIISRYKNEG